MAIHVRVRHDPVAHAALHPRRGPSSVRSFVSQFEGITGALTVLWLPEEADKLTNVSFPDTRVWTHANTQIGRVIPFGTIDASGRRVMVTMNGTTDRASATDTGLVSGAASRWMVALIRPTSVAVTDNPIFTYGTAAAKQAIAWELFSAKQRVGLFGTVSDVATTSQVVGRDALLGVSLNGATGVFSFFNNGIADGTATAIAAINTTLGGAGEAVIADFNTGAWGVGNKGNVTTGFVAQGAGESTAAIQAQIANLCREFYRVDL